MNTTMQKIFSEAEGRYLEDQEFQELQNYASSLPERVRASQAVEKAEEAIVSAAVDKMMQGFPELQKKHDSLEGKATRDVSLVLRYCTLAMVRDDMDFLEKKLLYWLRTILQSFFARRVLDVTYRELAMASQRHLDDDTLRLVAPYLKRAHEVLTMKR